jgi:hypothetical protein
MMRKIAIAALCCEPDPLDGGAEYFMPSQTRSRIPTFVGSMITVARATDIGFQFK